MGILKIYYRLLLESDDYVNDYKNWVQSILKLITNAYLRRAVRILTARYPDQSASTIEEKVNNIPQNLEKLLFEKINSERVVSRRGKTMHRLRAQLVALEYQGDRDLAERIKSKALCRIEEFTPDSLRKDFAEFYNRWLDILGIWDANRIESIVREMTKIVKRTDYMGTCFRAEGWIFDTYVLARMFRVFPGTDHKDSNRVLVLCGASHVSYMTSFLEQEGGRFWSFEGPGERCIEVPKDFLM